MQKGKILSILALGLLSILLVQTVSASIWEPQYSTYKLGSSQRDGGFSSTSTYEKVKVESEDRYGSDSYVSVKKTETETYIPTRTVSTYRYYDSDRYDAGYRYTDRYGYGRTYVKNNDVFIYNDGIAYPSTNWRYKEVYHDYDYLNENSYGYDYYYAPRYDWHRQVYNWDY